VAQIAAAVAPKAQRDFDDSAADVDGKLEVDRIVDLAVLLLSRRESEDGGRGGGSR
jgi:hypothetical protein